MPFTLTNGNIRTAIFECANKAEGTVEWSDHSPDSRTVLRKTLGVHDARGSAVPWRNYYRRTTPRSASSSVDF